MFSMLRLLTIKLPQKIPWTEVHPVSGLIARFVYCYNCNDWCVRVRVRVCVRFRAPVRVRVRFRAPVCVRVRFRAPVCVRVRFRAPVPVPVPVSVPVREREYKDDMVC